MIFSKPNTDMMRKRLPDTEMMRKRIPDTELMRKKVSSVSSLAPQRRQKKTSNWRSLFIGAVAGAVGMYFLDPRGGNRRRAMVGDKVTSLASSVSSTAPQAASMVADKAKGMQHKMTSMTGGQSHASDDDKTVTDRVMSEVFRDPDLPKGEVNVNTVDHVVYLRGHVEDPSALKEIEQRTRSVPGVKDVINLINRPDVDPSAVREAMEQRNEQKS